MSCYTDQVLQEHWQFMQTCAVCLLTQIRCYKNTNSLCRHVLHVLLNRSGSYKNTDSLCRQVLYVLLHRTVSYKNTDNLRRHVLCVLLHKSGSYKNTDSLCWHVLYVLLHRSASYKNIDSLWPPIRYETTFSTLYVMHCLLLVTCVYCKWTHCIAVAEFQSVNGKMQYLTMVHI